MSGIFNIGERVKVVGNSTGTNTPIGTFLTVKGYNNQFVLVEENHWNYYEIDLASAPFTLDDAERIASKMEGQYLAAQARVDFIKETGQEKGTEKEFRAWTLNKILASDMDNVAKAKRIESLYKVA